MHYVLCIRPNMKSVESLIEHDFFMNQIKQLQIVEITQFRSSAFPLNMTLQNFVKWYAKSLISLEVSLIL